ncbi:suppressor of fused domain protein [Aeoliella sp. SH292]|uniref:suppressor of fused domain protein n=1 Tax=Aeoliella sp. SH292 TaxID=3454464 RepID=UPI003F9D9AAA
MDDHGDPEPLGWNAIDEALRGIYGQVEPLHWGSTLPFALGGRDPITGISAFQDPDDRGVWHFVTYGFSELYEKEWKDPEVSGFGFELTFRLRTSDVAADANWVFNFLQNLGRYVFETGNAFGAGHTMPLNGPICIGSDTLIQCIVFTEDPELGQITTPNGSLEFLQIVGLTVDELQTIMRWNSSNFLSLAAIKHPKLVTDLSRDSWLNDADFAAKVENGVANEGASGEVLYSDLFSFSCGRWIRSCKLHLGALIVDDLTGRLCGRIPFGRPFVLGGKEAAIRFVPSDTNDWRIDNEILELSLNSNFAFKLKNELLPKAGTYKFTEFKQLTIVVDPTDIKDHDGNITQTIG